MKNLQISGLILNNLLNYRLQVSTLPYLYSGANKGGLHNISIPKINRNMVRRDLVKQIIKVIGKKIDVHYFTTFFEWCILSKLVLYFTQVSKFCLVSMKWRSYLFIFDKISTYDVVSILVLSIKYSKYNNKKLWKFAVFVVDLNLAPRSRSLTITIWNILLSISKLDKKDRTLAT